METLVAENSYRTEKPTTTLPGTFEQAKKVLPQPYWENHNDEIAMYWHAWKLALSNICHPKENSGFVNSYIAPAYMVIFLCGTMLLSPCFAVMDNAFSPFKQR